jgi:hypothetical protein
MLFYHFGWNVTGIDKDREAIQDALHNFSAEQFIGRSYDFILHDLSAGLNKVLKDNFEVLLIPNSLCYLERAHAESLLAEALQFVREGAYFFLSLRTLRDYRYGRGQMIGRNAFVLDTEETGEKGLVNVFYSEHELVDMLRRCLAIDVSTLEVFHLDFENLQQGKVISNSDVVMWGQVKR